MSIARGAQMGSNEADDLLTRQARQRRPNVKHWWGRRYLNGRNGAYCYLCSRHVATWDHRWPITEQARVQVDLHRSEHLQGRLDLRPASHGDER